MLTARHSPIHKYLLFKYARYRLRREFHAIRLSGAHQILETETTYPAVFFSNHGSWWDGFLEIPLIKQYALDYYVMMEAVNLEQFPFFQKCGVFGIDLRSREGRASGLLYTVRKLAGVASGKRTVFMYPEGQLTPAGESSITFQPGLATILKLSTRAHAIPVYKMIHYGKYPKAEVFIEIGDPIGPGSDAERTQAALEGALKKTRQSLLTRIKANNFQDALWLQAPPKNFRGKTD